MPYIERSSPAASVTSSNLQFALVAVELQRRLRGVRGGLPIPGQLRRVDEQQVRLAVAVVVDDRDAAAHRLGQQLLRRGAVLVLEPDAGGGVTSVKRLAGTSATCLVIAGPGTCGVGLSRGLLSQRTSKNAPTPAAASNRTVGIRMRGFIGQFPIATIDSAMACRVG